MKFPAARNSGISASRGQAKGYQTDVRQRIKGKMDQPSIFLNVIYYILLSLVKSFVFKKVQVNLQSPAG
jgi:hypothetical protein